MKKQQQFHPCLFHTMTPLAEFISLFRVPAVFLFVKQKASYKNRSLLPVCWPVCCPFAVTCRRVRFVWGWVCVREVCIVVHDVHAYELDVESCPLQVSQVLCTLFVSDACVWGCTRSPCWPSAAAFSPSRLLPRVSPLLRSPAASPWLPPPLKRPSWLSGRSAPITTREQRLSEHGWNTATIRLSKPLRFMQ